MAFHRCPECGSATHYHCTARSIIAAGIRQSCSDIGTEFSYHEPNVDQRLLRKIHDDASSIADYILDGMRANGLQLSRPDH